MSLVMLKIYKQVCDGKLELNSALQDLVWTPLVYVSKIIQSVTQKN